MGIENTLSYVGRYNITPQQIVTPTITANSAYASGNQIGGIMKVDNMVRMNSIANGDGTGFGSAEVHSVAILDGTGQNIAIDLVFFGLSPTLTNAGDKTAYSITKANQLAALCQGARSIGTSYSASAAAGTSSDGGNLSLNIVIPSSSATPNAFYCVAIARAAATWTSTTALSFIFNTYSD